MLQLKHAAEDIAATVVENIPPPQLKHVEAPALELYVPALQLVHVADDDVAYVPAAQFAQTAEDVAPTVVEYVPELQVAHAVVP